MWVAEHSVCLKSEYGIYGTSDAIDPAMTRGYVSCVRMM